mmetsp:Transcript_52855/g.113261  ORF Transcript_52855/g.113261 Transcript_52855/m.113261 type:complete len:201 (-) Transcript_52855:664-1266(-)
MRMSARNPESPLCTHYASEWPSGAACGRLLLPDVTALAAWPRSCRSSSGDTGVVVAKASEGSFEPRRVERAGVVAKDHARDAILQSLRDLLFHELALPILGRLRLLHVEETCVNQFARRQILEVLLHWNDDFGVWVQPLEQALDLRDGLRFLHERRLAQNDDVCELDLVQHQLHDAAVILLILWRFYGVGCQQGLPRNGF